MVNMWVNGFNIKFLFSLSKVKSKGHSIEIILLKPIKEYSDFNSYITFLKDKEQKKKKRIPLISF